MAFRFWRRVRLVPGVTLNLSKSGGSLSFGSRGGHFTMSPRGGRLTGGVPGTGVFYTHRVGRGRGKRRGARSASVRPPAPTVPPAKRLNTGFFQRLFTPKDEANLVDGMREFVLGHRERSLEYLQGAAHTADGAFLAAMLSLEERDLAAASRYLETADRKHRQLGRYLGRYGIDATASIGITPELAAHVRPSLRGVLLTRVEVHQRRGETDLALECLERLRKRDPDDVVVTLSFVDNDTDIHAALLLYKGRALSRVGLHTAAVDTLTKALRRRKDRPDELLRAIRYERALVYEAMGNTRRAREDLERVYSQAPDYEDVAERLGVGARKESHR
jgi:tetratricopeptide (TPR) repeat protein